MLEILAWGDGMPNLSFAESRRNKESSNSVCVDHLKFFADGERAYVNIIVMKRIVIFFLNDDTDVAPF